MSPFQFRILSAPCSVVRDATIDVVNRLDVASQASSVDHRLVFSMSERLLPHITLTFRQLVQRDAGRVSCYFKHCSTAIRVTGSFSISPEVRHLINQDRSFLFILVQR